MIQAGTLNKRITIQQQTKVSDSMGGFTVIWADVVTVWAAIWPVSANEQTQAQSTAMVISHRIRIRYRSVYRASWRVQFGNRYFNIVSIVNPNEASEYLDLMCKEVG